MQAGLGDATRDAFAITAQSGPLRAELTRPGAAAVELWPSPDVDGLGRFAAAAVPAEALRVVLEGLRTIQTGLGTTLDDLASALGMLAPADGTGHRAVLAPLRLFEDPAGWFTQGGVLSTVTGGPFDAERVIDLLEALKPFVGLDGTPRGAWPIADGLQVTATAAAAGATVSLSVDATSWLAGDASRAPFAAGLSASLALTPSGAPAPLGRGLPRRPRRARRCQHAPAPPGRPRRGRRLRPAALPAPGHRHRHRDLPAPGWARRRCSEPGSTRCCPSR